MNAWLVGYRIERVTERSKRWESIKTGAACDFQATAIHEARITVLMPDGSHATDALLSWTPAGGYEGRSGDTYWTAADPTVELDPGSYTFVASADGLSGVGGALGDRYTRKHRFRNRDSVPPFRSEPHNIVVGPTGTPEVTIRLAGRPGVQLRVLFPPGDRPNDVRIAALRLDANTPADPALLLGDSRVKSVWLSGTSEGLITALEPGSYLVGATLRGGRVVAFATTTVGSGPVTQDLSVAAGEMRDWVKVWVRAPDGGAVKDAQLECACDGSEGSGHSDVDVGPDPDGSYRVPNYERDAPMLGGSAGSRGERMGDGPRRYSVRAWSRKLGQVEVRYDPATDSEVTIQFGPPATLRVAITGFAESPDRSRVVLELDTADNDDYLEWPQRRAQIDVAGIATFPPLQPGSYDVTLRLATDESEDARRDARWSGEEVARTRVKLGAGETTVTLPFAGLADIVLQFEGEAPSVERLGADGSLERIRVRRGTTPEGDPTLKGLASGRYRLLTRAGDMWLDVPTAGPVAFRPRPYNCYQLKVFEHGYLFELGLRTGDLVVAIGGVEPTNAATLEAAMATAKTKETSSFTILRGTQRFDVTADVKRFDEDEGSVYTRWVR